MKVKVDGVKYKSVPEKLSGSCAGCVAIGGDGLCLALIARAESKYGDACGTHNVIWAVREPKVKDPQMVTVLVALTFKPGVSKEKALDHVANMIAPAFGALSSWRVIK